MGIGRAKEELDDCSVRVTVCREQSRKNQKRWLGRRGLGERTNRKCGDGEAMQKKKK